MMKFHKLIITIIALTACLVPAYGRELNDKLLNRPYADNRRWHLGFSIGAHTQDLRFVHNGLITPEGEEWRIEQNDYQPASASTVFWL